MPNLKPILSAGNDNVDMMAVQRVRNELNVINELVCAANGAETLA